MKKNDMKQFDEILNECIERIFKGESVEVCLDAFPEHAAELEPLLRTAADTHKAADILPRPEFRQRTAYEFQSAVRDMKPDRGGIIKWQLRWISVVSVLAAVLVAGSGTIAASADSLPDESLYNVKLFTEGVRLALTPSTLGKAQLYVEFTDTRVEEIVKMADKGDVKNVEQTTERMNTNLKAIASLIQPGKNTGEAEDSTSREILTASAAGDVPVSAAQAEQGTVPQPAAAHPVPAAGFEKALTSNETRLMTTENRNETIRTAPKTALSNTFGNKQEDTAKFSGNTGKYNKEALKTTVSRQAEKNTQDLQEVLQRAPDSVRSALERAIAVAEKGYEDALNNPGRKNK
jgi:hypothetical protein